MLAAAHSLLVIAYHVVARREPSRALGADSFDRQQPAATAKRLPHRLGYDVTLTAAPNPRAPLEAGPPHLRPDVQGICETGTIPMEPAARAANGGCRYNPTVDLG